MKLNQASINNKIKIFATVFPMVALINLCGVALFYYDFIGSQRHLVENASNKAMNLLNKALDFADQANVTVLEGADGTCNSSLSLLREHVAMVPLAQSINIVNNNNVYCSSLLDLILASDIPSLNQNGRLLIIPGDRIKKNYPLMVLRQAKWNLSALSAVDGLYIKMILGVSRDYSRMTLIVGNNTLNDQGVFNSVNNDSPFVSSMATSHSYPFKIKAEISNKIALSKFKKDYVTLVIGVFILSLFIGAQLIRARSMPISFLDELKRGLNNHEFTPFFQPLICAQTKKMIGIEVLMRWNHPEDGLIRPDLFIPQAESSGIIIEMTSMIINDVIQYLHVNRHLFKPGFHICFNITSAHFDSDDILHDCQSFQSVCGMNGWKLVLELTERSVLSDTPEVMNRILTLSSMGVDLSIDDFGTGYSNLTTLQKFKFNSIKIDQSFVSKIGNEENSQHILDSVIMMAKRMGLTLVAEGIEFEEQEKYLCNHGVDILQGYLYGKPMSPTNFLDYFLSYRNLY